MGAQAHSRRRRLLVGATALVVVVIAVVLHRFGGSDGFSLVSEDSGSWAYLAVFVFVFGDAVVPVLPGETTLNAASTLAANGSLDLGLVMLAGALGAIVGDSTLYWIARVSGRRLQPQLEKALHNDKVALASRLLGSNAPLLIIAGRYVPGLRFVVNASMGLQRYPYERFLLWSGIGGTLWALYTCGLAYLVGTALADFPLASVVISGLITTGALAVVFVVVRRQATVAPVT